MLFKGDYKCELKGRHRATLDDSLAAVLKKRKLLSEASGGYPMKMIATVVAVLALMGVDPCAAQRGPAYIGVVDGFVAGRELPLERQIATITAHVRAMGYGGAETTLQVSGPKSPIRFKTDDPIQFVAKVSNPELDPATLFELYIISARGEVRRVPVASYSLFGGVKTGSNKFIVPMEFMPYKNNLLVMRPTQPLAPGEYFVKPMSNDLSQAQTTTVFLFGVD